MSRKFNIKGIGNVGSAGDELRKVEAQNHHNFKIIPVENIVPNPLNDYPMDNIESLMKSIKEANDLIHNLRVKPSDDGKYVIISGERRYRAISLGIEREDPWFLEKFKHGIPCMVADRNLSPIDEEIQLIVANEEVRDLEPSLRRKKIARLVELYKAKNEETGENKSITKQIAEDLGLNERQVQRYNAINNTLISELQKAFDDSKITLTDASKFAALDEYTQKLIAQVLKEKDTITKAEIEQIKAASKAESEEILRLKKENEEFRNKLIKAEEESLKKKLEEEELKNKLIEEFRRENPDKQKIEELEKELYRLQKEQQDKALENEKIKSELRRKEIQIKQLSEKLINRTTEELSAEDREKLHQSYEINALVDDITKRLSKLTEVYKKYKSKYNEQFSCLEDLKKYLSKFYTLIS